jgi:general secretion pathway protein G
MRRNNRVRVEGFTLIELLLVVVIIGLLAAIVVPRLAGRAEDVKIDTTKASMMELRKALGLYEVDNGRFPTQDQHLLALIEKPTSAPEPKKWRKYLETREIPKDAWGKPFDYKNPGEVNTDGYDIISGGPDETIGNDDDIVMP